MAKADSVDCYQHRILQDTMAFQTVTKTWDKPFVRVLKHDDLGRAYYYLGRNYEDYYQDYTSAALCYIRGDRLHMSDPIMRGRVLSCMENICVLNNNIPMGISFIQGALREFSKSDNTWYYANCMLHYSTLELAQEHFMQADSLWRIAMQYHPDASYISSLYLHRATYFYRLHELDSALSYFQNVSPEVLSADDRSFAAMQGMQIYFALDSMDKAIAYAEEVIRTSKKSTECSNAYYVLMRQAEISNDIDKLTEYTHLRADIYRLRITQAHNLGDVVAMFENYIAQSAVFVRRIIVASAITFLILSLLICLIVYTINQRKRMDSTQAEIANHKQSVIEKQLCILASVLEEQGSVWSNDDEFLNTINLYLWNLADTLRRSYGLSTQEIKICVMTLLKMSRKEISEHILRAESSVPKLRSNVSKQLGTDSVHLRGFLLALMA